MGRINQALLQAIADKQNITAKGVYPQITKVVADTFLERDLAALVLATRHKININKYSSLTQRAQIRGYLTGNTNHQPSAHHQASAAEPEPSRAPRGRTGKAIRPKKTKSNSVFVVHGRDEPLRKSIFDFLRSLGLNPMEWSTAVAQAKGGNPYIGDILDAAMAKVQAVIVLFSPDELAQLKEQFWASGDKYGEGKIAGQARPNVLFEAGLALGAHPEKTVIVQVGQVRPFSDIAGKHVVRLSEERGRNDLANRLKRLGCPVEMTGDDWIRAGFFEPTELKPKKSQR